MLRLLDLHRQYQDDLFDYAGRNGEADRLGPCRVLSLFPVFLEQALIFPCLSHRSPPSAAQRFVSDSTTMTSRVEFDKKSDIAISLLDMLHKFRFALSTPPPLISS